MPHKVFGKSARVPTSNTLPDNKDNESNPKYTIALFKRIFNTQASTCKKLEHLNTKIRSKRYYDRKTNPLVFNKDDYVYLFKKMKEKKKKKKRKEYLFNKLRSKFDEQYKGLHKILEILGNNVKLAISVKQLRIVQ